MGLVRINRCLNCCISVNRGVGIIVGDIYSLVHALVCILLWCGGISVKLGCYTTGRKSHHPADGLYDIYTYKHNASSADFLAEVSRRIANDVSGASPALHNMTSKQPSTAGETFRRGRRGVGCNKL